LGKGSEFVSAPAIGEDSRLTSLSCALHPEPFKVPTRVLVVDDSRDGATACACCWNCSAPKAGRIRRPAALDAFGTYGGGGVLDTACRAWTARGCAASPPATIRT
jgi:hypothetical protein